MVLHFLDANIIIRHVTKDNLLLSRKAHNILKEIEANSITVTTCESVLAECVYVLSSKKLYRFSRKQIKAVLDLVLSLKGLKLQYKHSYQRALEIYASSNIDFTDALAIAHMERLKITDIYTFDKDFDGIAGIKRRAE